MFNDEMLSLRCFILALIGYLILPQPGSSDVGKGNRILIDRGFQTLGLVQPDDLFNLNTYAGANYTTVIWSWAYAPPASWETMSRLGPAPGFPWARWAGDENAVPPLGDEEPYLDQLVMLQLGDEWFLGEEDLRDRAVAWLNAIRDDFPATILYVNNYGGQVGDSALIDFTNRARPDMLCFDTYPWLAVYDPEMPDKTGPALGGPPTAWYGELRRYRDITRAANIPFGSYNQTFASVEDWDGGRVYRHPTPSELRLNMFAAQAFNAKVLIDFTYNSGASSLFDRNGSGQWAGDSIPNARYHEKAAANNRARNFGQALVRLQPIDEGTSQWTTSIVFIRGRDPSGTLHPVPINFYAGPAAADPHTDWLANRNDPYLRRWFVTNDGTRNNRQPGDVILSWFKVLDESFDGPDHTDEIYMMVVNGLTDTDPNGAAADCLQRITLDFSGDLTAVERLDPLTGDVVVQMLPVVNEHRQLVLDLEGGDAALFKFSTGAPFVGAEVVGPPIITRHPESRTQEAGTDATFSVVAPGSAPLSYRWQFNGEDIDGADESHYTRPEIRPDDAGAYRVIISNGLGDAISDPANLTVHTAPEITKEPLGQTTPSGSNVQFTVEAAGTQPLSYQWQFNRTNIARATNSSFLLPDVQPADAGTYSVLVSNPIGTTPSAGASLAVHGVPQIVAQPGHQALLPGGHAIFSCTALGPPPLTYRWQRDGSDLSDTGGISGATMPDLSIANIQNADLGAYHVTIANAFGETTSLPATLTFATTPSIETEPENQAAAAGATAVFSVTAGGGGLTYQWQRDGIDLTDGPAVSGATTARLVLNGLLSDDAGLYTVVIVNAAGTATTQPAALDVVIAPPFREPFNYPPGENIGGQVSPNSLHWHDVGTGTSGPHVTVQTGNLKIAALTPPFGNSIGFGGLGKSARLSLPNAFISGTIYYSLLLRIDDLTGARESGAFIAGFNNSTGTQSNQPTAVATRLYIRTAPGGGFQLGVAKNTSTSTDWAWHDTVFDEGQTIFIVGSYSFATPGNTTDDVSKLWINPPSSSFGSANPPPPALIATAGNDISADRIASFVFFQRGETIQPAAATADDLRIGTSWDSVAPQPKTFRIDSIQSLPGARLHLQSSGDPGIFAVESSVDLVHWREILEIVSTTGRFEWADPIHDRSRRFYRAFRLAP